MSVKKPVGQYEIDWSHPLAKDLKYYILDGEDLVAKSRLSAKSGATITRGMDFNATSSYFDFDKIIKTTYPFTLVGVSNHDTLNHAIILQTDRHLKGNYDYTGVMYRHDSNGQIFLRFGDGAGTGYEARKDYTSDIGSTAGNIMIGTWVVRSFSDLTPYINGKVLTIDSTSGSASSIVNSLNNSIVGEQYLTGSAGLTDSKGMVFASFFYNRELSTEEVLLLHQDPYQFLKPVRTVHPTFYPALLPCPVIDLVTDTTKGNLTLEANGDFTYSYTGSNTTDTDSFEYTLTDVNGASHTALVTLNISANPVARDDAFTVSASVQLVGDVLSDNGSGVDLYEC